MSFAISLCAICANPCWIYLYTLAIVSPGWSLFLSMWPSWSHFIKFSTGFGSGENAGHCNVGYTMCLMVRVDYSHSMTSAIIIHQHKSITNDLCTAHEGKELHRCSIGYCGCLERWLEQVFFSADLYTRRPWYFHPSLYPFLHTTPSKSFTISMPNLTSLINMVEAKPSFIHKEDSYPLLSGPSNMLSCPW